MINNNIRETIEKHKRIIVLAIVAAALASYMLPFDNMYGMADAVKSKVQSFGVKAKQFKPNFFAASHSGAGSSPSASQNPLLFGANSGGGGGGSSGPSTTFNFEQTQSNSCSGFAQCSNFATIQFSPYGFFGGGA